MAHKKGLGSSRNGRDSNPKMLGVKKFAGEAIRTGSDHRPAARAPSCFQGLMWAWVGITRCLRWLTGRWCLSRFGGGKELEFRRRLRFPGLGLG